jgi:hypothetical protein
VTISIFCRAPSTARKEVGKARLIGTAVERVETHGPETRLGKGGPAIPGGVEIAGEEACRASPFDSNHHVVPGEIMVAEVDPADIGDVVGDDQLLVVAKPVAEGIEADRVGRPHANAASSEPAEHGPGRTDLGAKAAVDQIEGRWDEMVVDHQAGEIVDQNPAIAGAAGADRPGDGEAGAVAFEGHRLDEEARARLRDIFRGPAPESLGSDEKLKIGQKGDLPAGSGSV